MNYKCDGGKLLLLINETKEFLYFILIDDDCHDRSDEVNCPGKE